MCHFAIPTINLTRSLQYLGICHVHSSRKSCTPMSTMCFMALKNPNMEALFAQIKKLLTNKRVFLQMCWSKSWLIRWRDSVSRTFHCLSKFLSQGLQSREFVIYGQLTAFWLLLLNVQTLWKEWKTWLLFRWAVFTSARVRVSRLILCLVKPIKALSTRAEFSFTANTLLTILLDLISLLMGLIKRGDYTDIMNSQEAWALTTWLQVFEALTTLCLLTARTSDITLLTSN